MAVNEMQHLKGCPWNEVPWRPAQLQLSTTNASHQKDYRSAIHYVKHGDASPIVAKPKGLDQTLREAVRAGQWPSLDDARQASFCTSGWQEWRSQSLRGNVPHLGTFKTSDGATRQSGSHDRCTFLPEASPASRQVPRLKGLITDVGTGEVSSLSRTSSIPTILQRSTGLTPKPAALRRSGSDLGSPKLSSVHKVNAAPFAGDISYHGSRGRFVGF